MPDPYQDALALLPGAATWHDLRRTLEERHLFDRLGPADLQALLDAWHAHGAGAMDDATLAAELAFWADGGRFADHLEGFQAVPPAALLAEAERRGWFVRRLPSAVLINPPRGRPLRLALPLA